MHNRMKAGGTAPPSAVSYWQNESRRHSAPGANLITGAIVTETVFAWPGIGRLTYEAVIYRDFPLLQAVIILKSILILSINLGVDILYAYVDPRIRLA